MKRKRWPTGKVIVAGAGGGALVALLALPDQSLPLETDLRLAGTVAACVIVALAAAALRNRYLR